MLYYPLLITCPKASHYLYNKEEIDSHSNLVTESKVTECNRISLTSFTTKSMSHSQDKVKKSQSLLSIMCVPFSCLDTFQASLSHAMDKTFGVVL